MDKHYTLGIYDYDKNKICDLYDSQVELFGAAYDITVTEEFNGYHTLNFTIPFIVPQVNIYESDIYGRYGSGIFDRSMFGKYMLKEDHNYRWDFLKSEYLIRYTCDNKNIWFVANKPTKSKSGKKIVGIVECAGTESLLKTRNIYMTFDDENGIDTIQNLMTKILKGTGWHLDDRNSDTMYERDGITEKIRSLNNSSKKGALDLITTVCNLFQARPVFDTDEQTVAVKAIRNRQQVLEGVVGKNLSALNVKQDSGDICTRVYVEGEYGDYGYVGIDDVEVDGEPWGLPFLVNFDYYREIGLFKQDHEDALETYLHDIRIKKAEIRQAGQALTQIEDQLNEMIGQCDVVVYYKSTGYTTPKYEYGEMTAAQKTLNVGDEVVILQDNNTHTYEEWTGLPVSQMANAYAVAKFVTKAAGKIGSAEVQIESKQKEITQLQRKKDATVKEDKKAEYQAEIDRLNGEISTIYNGSASLTGLYEMMSGVMKSDGMLYDRDVCLDTIDTLNAEQDDIEATFIAAMGNMLRDGYWSDQNYTVGQEEYLYADALDMTEEMSKPKTDYTFSYVRVTEDFDIPTEEIEINSIFKLYDEDLNVDDKMFVKKVTFGVDDKSLGSIEVSNQDITLTGNDLGSLLSRMSQLADLIEQKNALYERAKALTSEGSLYTDRLNGQIDVLKTQLLASVSNWFTDDNGNIMFLSADGGSAMMLCGAGFMIADGKDDNGDWNWRTFGTGHGFTADEIVAGFISADRIEAGSISTSKVTSDFGRELIIASSQYIQLSATDFDSIGDSSEGIYIDPDEIKVSTGGTVNIQGGAVNIKSTGSLVVDGGSVEIKSSGTFKLDSTNLNIATDGTVTAKNLALNGGSITLKDGNTTKFSVSSAGYLTSVSGEIGGWTIADHSLHSGTGNTYVELNSNPSSTYAIWAGDGTAGNAEFRVTRSGVLYATGAEISGNSTFNGTVSANSVIACNISANNIVGGTLTLGGNNNTSGQMSIKDASGNVIGSWSNTGISATAGTIGGWTINSSNIASGSSASKVVLNSDTTTASVKDYAMWAGGDLPTGNSSAPFKVKRNGEVYLTKLMIQKETDSGSGGTVTTEEVDLTSNSNRLRGGTILGWNDNNGELYTTYGTINFNSPSSVRAGWTGDTYTVTNRSGTITLASTTIDVSTGIEPGTGDAKFYAYYLSGSNPVWIKSKDITVNFSTSSGAVPSSYTRATKIKVGNAVTDFDLSPYWDAAYAEGYPSGTITIGSKVTGTVYNVSISPTSGSARATTKDFASIYSDARAGYTQGTFTLASVTLQGTPAGTCYPVNNSGTTYYTAGSAYTYYKGDGGTYTVQGTSAGLCYEAATSGGTLLYTAGTAEDLYPMADDHYANYTGTLYTNGTIPAGTGSWHCLGYSWIGICGTKKTVTPIGSTSIRVKSTSASTKYNAGTSSVVGRGNTVSGTNIGSTSIKLGTSGLKYNAGSTVTNTYYTKS